MSDGLYTSEIQRHLEKFSGAIDLGEGWLVRPLQDRWRNTAHCRWCIVCFAPDVSVGEGNRVYENRRGPRGGRIKVYSWPDALQAIAAVGRIKAVKRRHPNTDTAST
jgi:hypothetical protein